MRPCACAITLRPKSSPLPGNEPPLPDFYSLLSAVKVEPRLSLKDFTAGGAQSSVVGSTQRGSRSDDSDTSALLGQGVVPTTGCFVRLTGMLRMLWGRDTSDDAELPPPLWPAPPPAGAGNRDTTTVLSPHAHQQQQSGGHQQGLELGRWESAEWSVPAGKKAERSFPCVAPHHLHADDVRALGGSSGLPQRGDPTLEHAISIPPNDMWPSRDKF